MTFWRKLRTLDLETLRAAWWTATQVRAVKRQLPRLAYADVRVAAPPPLPRAAGRGVEAVLRRTPATCLQRALVLQSWLRAQGTPRDVIIGVTGADGFRAHAWVDGEAPPSEFRELTRIPAL